MVSNGPLGSRANPMFHENVSFVKFFEEFSVQDILLIIYLE